MTLFDPVWQIAAHCCCSAEDSVVSRQQENVVRGGCGGARGFLNSFNHATMLLIIPAYSHQTVSYLLTRTTQPDAAASLALTLCATSCTFSWVTPLESQPPSSQGHFQGCKKLIHLKQSAIIYIPYFDCMKKRPSSAEMKNVKSFFRGWIEYDQLYYFNIANIKLCMFIMFADHPCPH